MKVAFFQFFPPTVWTPGGGETQLAKTKEALEQLGVQVDLFDIWTRKRDYDILHVFGSTYQLSDFVVAAKRLGTRVVVSPITYTTKPMWMWKLWRSLDRLLPVPTTYTYRQRIYDAADVLLPGSAAEAAQLRAIFRVPQERMAVVFNAADRRFAEASSVHFVTKFGLKDFVLMSGRISRHKGQLRLVQALEGQGLELVFIGQMDPDDPLYFDQFQEACKHKKWVHYLGFINTFELLASAYAAAKVHALPSFGECPGLVSLEAGLAGAQVVAVKDPPVYEHLGDDAFYCDPRSISSIRQTVLHAYTTSRNERLQKRLLNGFTWEAVANKLVPIYSELLNA